ncbi:AraC-like DNA-binding protein [Paenibacillus sp. BK033]|uniref:helix-turn-helix domain-containing protein n=1 Tax=Paenibacillus sp. BK033 TaxID=2512133 RepID=UPI00104B943A|nr:AraC family transcriptional regulator [Paenibacillus sp. BK033]TCN01221.1 AraC-like DNA-binding protein [Paenibacillus sp. BK033]
MPKLFIAEEEDLIPNKSAVQRNEWPFEEMKHLFDHLATCLSGAIKEVKNLEQQYLNIIAGDTFGTSKPNVHQLYYSYKEALKALEQQFNQGSELYRKLSLNPGRTPKRKVQQALEVIEASYADHGMTLAGVAKALFVSSTYLSTLFKQELGINFLDYVHQFRIEKAKALLQTGDMKIHSVAKEVGYYDEAHFTKTFKKWTGMLPSQYKKEMAVSG